MSILYLSQLTSPAVREQAHTFCWLKTPRQTNRLYCFHALPIWRPYLSFSRPICSIARISPVYSQKWQVEWQFTAPRFHQWPWEMSWCGDTLSSDRTRYWWATIFPSASLIGMMLGLPMIKQVWGTSGLGMKKYIPLYTGINPNPSISRKSHLFDFHLFLIFIPSS